MRPLIRSAPACAFAVGLASLALSDCTCDDGISTLNAKVEIEPAQLDFGTVALGTSKDLTFVLRNKGTISLDIEGYSVAPPFVGPTGTATVGTASEIELSVTFTPVALGPASGTLSIMTSDPDAPVVEVPLIGEGIEAAVKVEPLMIDFGEVLWNNTTNEATQQVMVSNPGTDSFDLTAVDLVNDAAGAFAIDLADVVKTYGPGDTGTFSVSYLPTAMGPVMGSVKITTTARAAPEIVVTMIGTAVGPELELCAGRQGAAETCTAAGQQPLLDFGLVPLSMTSQGSIRIINAGDRDMNIGAVMPQGNATEFAFTPDPSTFANIVIGPGQERVLDATFTPVDYVFDSIIVTVASDSATRRTGSVRVEGRVPHATIDLVPRGLTFRLSGGVTRNEASVRIFNCGQLDLTISDITLNYISGPVTDAFSMTNAPTPGTVLAPGMCPNGTPGHTFQVVFETTTSGTYSAEIVVSSNDPNNPTMTVTVEGTKT